MRLPSGSRSWARVAAGILGLIVAPVSIALGETLRRGNARSFCFVAAGVAVIVAIALIADSLEVHVDRRAGAGSRRESSARMPSRRRKPAGSP